MVEMHALVFVIFFALIPEHVHSRQYYVWERYSLTKTSREMSARMVNLTKSTYHDVALRISDVNFVRFLYEKTPTFEQGYVFSEIIERYKKMVEQYRRLILRVHSVYNALDKVEHMQKLYFDVYHLVMMMHEIPRKYQGVGQYKDILMTAEEKEQSYKEKLAFQKAQREREIAAKLLVLAQKHAVQKKVGGAGGALLGLKSKQKYSGSPAELHKTFPQRWPIDYGWEPEEF